MKTLGLQLAAVALSASACMEPHDAVAVSIADRDCYPCHRKDYEAAPNHVGARSTVCADCHRLADWKGLLPGTHREQGFVISRGPHQAILCADCHDPDVNADSTVRPTTMDHNTPVNVTCVGCHTGAHDVDRMTSKHREVAEFHWDPSRPAFCRDCHAFGLNN